MVEGLKLFSPAVKKPWALVRVHQGPLLILLHALHEEVRNPQSVEQIAGSLFLLPCVLLAVQELENVCMPWLQVNGEGTRPLSNAKVGNLFFHITK